MEIGTNFASISDPNAGIQILNDIANDKILIEPDETAHKILIHLKDGSIRQSAGPMKTIKVSLGKQFYQCDRSYIVHLNHIIEMNEELRLLTVTGGNQITVSYRRIAGLRTKIEDS